MVIDKLLQAGQPHFLLAGSREETLEPALVVVADGQEESTLGRVHGPVSQRSLSVCQTKEETWGWSPVLSADIFG